MKIIEIADIITGNNSANPEAEEMNNMKKCGYRISLVMKLVIILQC